MWLIRSVYHKPMAIANQFSEQWGGQGTAIDKIGGGARHLCRFSARSTSDLRFIRASQTFVR